MYQLLDGKQTSIAIKDQIANEVRSFIAKGIRPPHLAAILVGDDGASQTYVANKEKSSHEVGFTSSVYRYSANTSEEELLKAIEFLNNDDDVDGFIVQLPLPKQINEQKVIKQKILDKIVLIKPLLVGYNQILNLESGHTAYHIYFFAASLCKKNVL